MDDTLPNNNNQQPIIIEWDDEESWIKCPICFSKQICLIDPEDITYILGETSTMESIILCEYKDPFFHRK